MTAKASPLNKDPLLDFRNFLYLVWQHVLPNAKPSPVQYDIAKFLQHGPRRLVIEAFRGVGKSWVTSAFVCHQLYCNPQLNILVISASKQRSDDFSTFTMRLILEMEVLAHLRPGPDQRQSKIAFDVGPARASHAPSVKSLGITSQIAGSRADIIIADDVEVPNNSDTQLKRDQLGERIKEFDAVLKKDGRIIYLGTPQSEQSIYNLLPERGYTIRIWPARFPTEERRLKYGGKLAPFIEGLIAAATDRGDDISGHPVDPTRFNDTDLTERELSYGRSGFSLQFMLDTSLADQDKFPLRLSDLIVMGLDGNLAPSKVAWASSPDLIWDNLPCVGMPGDRYHRPMFTSKDSYLDYEGSMMFVDPSGRGKDETAWSVVKMLHGNLYFTAMGVSRGEGYSKEVLERILRCAKAQKCNLIQVEPNFGDGMFSQLLRSEAPAIYPCAIEDGTWAKNQKEVRIIDTLEPIMNQHRLIVDPSIIEQDYSSTDVYAKDEQVHMRLFHQMTRITRARGALAHDDRLDSLAGAVAYWIQYLAKNDTTSHQSLKEDALQKELDKFLDYFGGKKGGDRFF